MENNNKEEIARLKQTVINWINALEEATSFENKDRFIKREEGAKASWAELIRLLRKEWKRKNTFDIR